MSTHESLPFLQGLAFIHVRLKDHDIPSCILEAGMERLSLHVLNDTMMTVVWWWESISTLFLHPF